MGFFDDIFIPKENMPASCKFVKDRQAWSWTTDDNEPADYRTNEVGVHQVLLLSPSPAHRPPLLIPPPPLPFLLSNRTCASA